MCALVDCRSRRVEFNLLAISTRSRRENAFKMAPSTCSRACGLVHHGPAACRLARLYLVCSCAKPLHLTCSGCRMRCVAFCARSHRTF